MTRGTRPFSSSSSAKKFDVFEFNEADEINENASWKGLSNPSSNSVSMTKYDFLQAFAGGAEPEPVSKHVTADPIDLDSDLEEEEVVCIPEEPVEIDDDDDEDDGGGGGGGDAATGIGDNQGEFDNACTIDVPVQQFADNQNPGYLDFAETGLHFENQLLDVLSDDDDGSSQTSSSSTSTYAAFEINHIKKVVDVSPDFIQYEDLYSTQSRLIFSCTSLKLEGSQINGSRGTFKIEWEIEDIISIESHWCEKIETASINLLLKSKDFRESGISNQNPGSKMLKFTVYDSHWSKAEIAIKLLDVRYSDIWNTVFDIDTDNKGSISALGKDSFFSHRPYFPIFDETFDEVIYPKGEPDAVSISKRDIGLLQPETFINDTIIDFYIKYLKNKLPTDEQEKFHFFNSFFFRKLADLDKNPSSACNGREAFQRVRKWTRKVNLFEKDYILIPINYSLHWSLVVICHPGEVTRVGGEEIKESSKVPCILHMDSLKGSHKGLKDVFQSYLCEEWKERHANVEDDLASEFLHLRFISLELPQQENLYDCGLFLLHYVECFLKEAPVNFNPFKITKFSNFLKNNWFPPAEASLKRSHIHNLIYDISGNNFLQAPPADCHDKGLSSEVSGVIKHKVDVDSPGVCCYPATWHGNPSNSRSDIQFPTASPISPCIRRGFMSTIEETEEFREETAISLENSQVGMLATDFPSTSYISKDHRASETAQQEFSVKTSTVSWNTLDTYILEDQPLQSIEEFNPTDKTALAYLSTYEEELGDSIVQDSQEANVEHDVDVNVKSHSLFRENANSVAHPVFDLTHMSLDDDVIFIKEESLASESNERDAKRPKLMNATGGSSGRRPFTRSRLKEAYV
ncbi:probable ubiquitin-like-specific protease 2A isoform X2 [Lotus japonicus]|uniref:probable ubiquitin-like-specific protease 2A isoform X2 n=1 Tax=Lotus japonicus TaxID=34305 RepID=UPI00258C4A51|nr:probable ubiquitin-like-specific protease 2A isoform X2 [Lotus japonicus]